MTTTDDAMDNEQLGPRATDAHFPQAAIEADPRVPAVHIWRDFDATPIQVLRAHTDPDLFVQWIGPDSVTATIDHWDCRTLGSYRYLCGDQAFRGTFPEVSQHRLVQTFTWEGMPEAIALETMTFTDLGDGRTRLHAFSLCDSFEGRNAMLASGMDIGVNEGYAKLDRLLLRGSSQATT